VRFFHGLLIDERPVGRAEVSNNDIAVVDEDVTMRGGNRRLVDLKMIVLASPKGIDAFAQRYFPCALSTRVDDEPSHGSGKTEALYVVSRDLSRFISVICHLVGFELK
jgi:hypothetical protein